MQGNTDKAEQLEAKIHKMKMNPKLFPRATGVTPRGNPWLSSCEYTTSAVAQNVVLDLLDDERFTHLWSASRNVVLQ